MRDPAAGKGLKPTVTDTFSIFKRPFAGLGLPVPCPPGKRGRFALQGGLPGPRRHAGARGLQTFARRVNFPPRWQAAVISTRFPL